MEGIDDQDKAVSIDVGVPPRRSIPSLDADSTAWRARIPRDVGAGIPWHAGPPFHGKSGRLGRGRTTQLS